MNYRVVEKSDGRFYLQVEGLRQDEWRDSNIGSYSKEKSALADLYKFNPEKNPNNPTIVRVVK
jgi:hypothetical protein